MGDPTRAGVAEIVRRTSTGEITARDVLEASLAAIAARDHQLNAFSVVLADAAGAESAARDAALAAGEPPGLLHGVPVAIKEEVAVAGAVTTFGGNANTTPAADDAELVRRLRSAGAVIVGKTTMSEFGAGRTPSPWPARSPATRGSQTHAGRIQRR